MSDPARDFAKLYADLIGEPRESSQAAQRARLLLRLRSNAARRPMSSGLTRFRTPLLAAALTVAASVGVWLWSSSSEPPWQARVAGTQVLSGARLLASASPLSVDFPDGSQLWVAPSAEAKLVLAEASNTELVLERGQLSGRVLARPGASFRIAAGPYRVQVQATTFSVDWDRSSGFRVVVREGDAEVRGGDLPLPGVHLKAGEELRRGPTAVAAAPGAQSEPPTPPMREVPAEDTAERTAENTAENTAEASRAERAAVSGTGALGTSVLDTGVASADAPRRTVSSDHAAADRVEAAASPRNDSPLNESASDATVDVPTTETSRADAADTSWQALARQGDYTKALNAAEALGFANVLDTTSATDLLLLANAARYARKGERAKQAYTSIRQRFASSNAARLSAFYLARLAGDVEGQPKSEARWLRTYLAEAPRGELAASARARLMEILRRSGDLSGARAVAGEYLRFHPAGPHAEVARSLLRASPSP